MDRERGIHMKKEFGIFTVLLLIVILFCAKGTVMSKEDHERTRQNRYYAALEEEYLEKARRLFEEEGYHNCGINLTRVTLGDGSRQYRMSVHHRKLLRMSQAEHEELVNRLYETEFRDGVCSFLYELNP